MGNQALVKEQCPDLVSEAYMPPTYNGDFDIPIQLYARAASKSREAYHSAYPHAQKISQNRGQSEKDFATTATGTLSMQIR
jgi:hypothetical protein